MGFLPVKGPGHVEDGRVPGGEEIVGRRPRSSGLIDGDGGQVDTGIALDDHHRHVGRQVVQHLRRRGKGRDNDNTLYHLVVQTV